MFSGNSNLSNSSDFAFAFITGISVFLLVAITLFMIYCVWRYSRKRNPKASPTHESMILEALWIIIPTILVMFMFYFGWTGFKVMRNVPEGAMEVKVTGRMWAWSYTYANGKESDVLKLPVGKPVKLNLASNDVIHSFYIPAFRIKEDALPNGRSYMWFTPQKLGVYQVFCAEYCGLNHAAMLSKVDVVTEEDYVAWLNQSAEIK